MAKELKLTTLERIFLVNQLKILEALYPDEASSYSVQRESIERGYELLYAFDYQFIYDDADIMTPEESREVWDTMDMFDAIARSMPNDFVTDDYPLTKFAGYDGNNETKFMSFARFTVERLGRFEYVPMQKAGSWNSHFPVREAYQRMLEVWKNLPGPNKFNMTDDQLVKVLSAGTRPRAD